MKKNGMKSRLYNPSRSELSPFNPKSSSLTPTLFLTMARDHFVHYLRVDSNVCWPIIWHQFSQLRCSFQKGTNKGQPTFFGEKERKVGGWTIIDAGQGKLALSDHLGGRRSLAWVYFLCAG